LALALGGYGVLAAPTARAFSAITAQ
jgi:hypothetical protein